MMTKKSTALIILQDRLKWTDSESFAFIAPMKENSELRTRIGSTIRTARKQRGYVMRQIADAARVSVGAVGNWERGANELSVENLRAVARFLNIDQVALSEGRLQYLDENRDDLADAEIVTDFAPIQTGPLDVEILGIAVGGDEGDFSLNGEVAGYARRPPGIAHLRRVFALHIISDSMWPRYEPGEMIYCGGRAAIAGDDVVIEMFPTEGEPAGKAYVKRLTKRTTAQITCIQFNPQKELVFDAYAIKNIWRIIPLRELLGY